MGFMFLFILVTVSHCPPSPATSSILCHPIHEGRTWGLNVKQVCPDGGQGGCNGGGKALSVIGTQHIPSTLLRAEYFIGPDSWIHLQTDSPMQI